MDLQTATRLAAEAIGKGGLRDTPSASQVARESWSLLADMNAAGMLTFDSQDAPPGAEQERPYVMGFMATEQAAVFVDALNRHTDKIATVIHPCRRYECLGRITLTKAEDGSHTWLPLYMSLADHRFQRKEAGLRPSAAVTMVACLDARWGRCAWKRGGLFRDVVMHLRAASRTDVSAERGSDASGRSDVSG